MLTASSMRAFSFSPLPATVIADSILQVTGKDPQNPTYFPISVKQRCSFKQRIRPRRAIALARHGDAGSSVSIQHLITIPIAQDLVTTTNAEPDPDCRRSNKRLRRCRVFRNHESSHWSGSRCSRSRHSQVDDTSIDNLDLLLTPDRTRFPTRPKVSMDTPCFFR